MQRSIREHDVFWWAEEFLRAAAATEVSTLQDAPLRDWASLPTHLRLGKAFQQGMIERLMESGKALAKALP